VTTLNAADSGVDTSACLCADRDLSAPSSISSHARRLGGQVSSRPGPVICERPKVQSHNNASSVTPNPTRRQGKRSRPAVANTARATQRKPRHRHPSTAKELSGTGGRKAQRVRVLFAVGHQFNRHGTSFPRRCDARSSVIRALRRCVLPPHSGARASGHADCGTYAGELFVSRPQSPPSTADRCSARGLKQARTG
jgi:hypothetical protein